ncbi:MAG: amidohydrolase family protein [Woeseia sp.]
MGGRNNGLVPDENPNTGSPGRRWLPAMTIVLLVWLSGAAEALARQDVMAIHSSWLIDGTGASPLADAVVVIRGNRIEAVGTKASVSIPAGAEVIDLPGQTLMPGLIDTHSHLANRSLYPSRFSGFGPANEEMMRVIRAARVLLLCGITTVRQVGERHFNDILFKEAVEAGMHVGPRIISSGLPITVTGGHFATEVDGADAFRKAVRENFEAGAEWIKLTHIDMTSTTGTISSEELEAAVDEAHRLGLKVTVHATGRWGAAMKTAIEAGVDNIEHARPLTEDMVKLMLEHGTTASLTPMAYAGFFPLPETYEVMDTGVTSASEWMDYLNSQVDEYRKAHPENETGDRPFVSPISGTSENWRVERDRFQALKTVQAQYLRAHRLGLRFSLGLDNRLGGMAWQMQFLVDAGIPEMDVIQIATSTAADLIGYGDRIGTVEKGKLADLISVEGNPLRDMSVMTRIRLVVKDGIRYDTLSWR